jgi:hypothetical protein
MKRLVLFAFVLLPMTIAAKSRIIDPQIKSLQAVVNQDWLSPAVMRLHSDDVLNVSFDELSHDYHRYIYRVEHCEANWTSSTSLFESDWLEGFNNNPIDDYDRSVNTTMAYTHYKFQIPNDRMRLRLSGNYRIHIYDNDDDEREVMTVDFCIAEQSMPLSMTITTNTDIDTNVSHQQVSLAVNYGVARVTDPANQLRVVVMQNGREDNWKVNPKPTILSGSGAEWQHSRELIFDAGNEYRKYEVLDVSHPTMGIDHIHWNGEGYEVYPFIDEPRPHYLYDEDANGSFFIRNSDNWQIETTCEYVWVMYRMKCQELLAGKMIIDGWWTTDDNRNTYEMTYDQDAGMYTAKVLQKQGYYSYQYLWQHPDGSVHTAPSEGSFYQTENRYQALVYYRGINDQTWRLTAFRQLTINKHD